MENQVINQTSQIDEDAKALKDFLTNIKCLEPIKNNVDKFNIFDVFGFAKNEIRHSFVLKWLLDPKESHGLGDSFARALITYLVSTEPERYDNVFKLLMLDCSDFWVQREMKDIDLFLCSKSKSVAVVIENKVGAHEHPSNGFDSQLDKYKEYVENEYKHIGTKIYVYLTPQKESASDEETWQSLSYSEIVDILEEIIEDNQSYISSNVLFFLKNYIAIIRRDIVEDNELKALCNEIYYKYRKALELIYKHSDMGMNPTYKIIADVLTEKASQGKIEYNQNDKAVFHSTAMTEFLPKLSEPKSSWDSVYPYNYWFKVEGEKVYFVFELGFWGIDDDTKKKFDAFIKTRHPRNKKETGRYKRVEKFDWVNLEDFDEDVDKKKKISEIIDKVLIEEQKWINECREQLVE